MSDLLENFRTLDRQHNVKKEERKLTKKGNRITWAAKVAVRRNIPVNTSCCAYGCRQLVGDKVISIGPNTLIKSVACDGCVGGREAILAFEATNAIPEENTCALLETQYLVIPKEIKPNTLINTTSLDFVAKNKKRKRNKFNVHSANANKVLQKLALEYKEVPRTL